MKKNQTDGMTTREIAALLGVSHVTVANIEKRALAKMAAFARREKMECVNQVPDHEASNALNPIKLGHG